MFFPPSSIKADHRSNGLWHWGRVAMLCLCLGLVCSGKANPKATDAQLSSAITYKIARFTEWPADVAKRDKTFNIGVLGTPADVAAFRALEGRTLQGKAIRIIPLDLKSDIRLVRSCQAVYTADAEGGEFVQRSAAGQAILSVCGTAAAATGKNSCVRFLSGNGKLGFGVNLQIVQKSGLSIDSTILGYASEVQR